MTFCVCAMDYVYVHVCVYTYMLLYMCICTYGCWRLSLSVSLSCFPYVMWCVVVCVCLLYVRIHVCMQMGICVCMPACGSLKWIWGVFFDCTPFCLLRHCLSAEPRTWGLTGLTSYLALRIIHLGLPSPWLWVVLCLLCFSIHSGYLNSSLHVTY